MLTKTKGMLGKLFLVSFPSGGGLGVCSLDFGGLEAGFLRGNLGDFRGDLGALKAAMSLSQSLLATPSGVGLGGRTVRYSSAWPDSIFTAGDCILKAAAVGRGHAGDELHRLVLR